MDSERTGYALRARQMPRCALNWNISWTSTTNCRTDGICRFRNWRGLDKSLYRIARWDMAMNWKSHRRQYYQCGVHFTSQMAWAEIAASVPPFAQDNRHSPCAAPSAPSGNVRNHSRRAATHSCHSCLLQPHAGASRRSGNLGIRLILPAHPGTLPIGMYSGAGQRINFRHPGYET